MPPRIPLLRLPTRRPFRAPARFTSNTSASRAARVIEMAAHAQKPSPLEAGVPLLWAACGGLACVAWGRRGDGDVSDVEKLIIV